MDKLKSRKLWGSVLAFAHLDVAAYLGLLSGREFLAGLLGILAIYVGGNLSSKYAFNALLASKQPAPEQSEGEVEEIDLTT